MQNPMWKHLFNGKDPLRILDFQAEFLPEADIRGMSETQAFIALPSFQTGFGQSLYETVVEMTPPKRDRSSCWPEAV